MKSTCWDTRATDSIIKSGQKDTEESIFFNRFTRAEFRRKSLSKKHLKEGFCYKYFQNPLSICCFGGFSGVFFASFRFFLLHVIVSCLGNL